MQVNCFNEKLAKQELKKCPKIVREYVKLLEKNTKVWQDLTQVALKKLKKT